MSNTPHELAEEFPEKAERIHQLKTGDPHFRKLFDQYHEVNRAVHRAETRVDVMDDAAEQALRRQRLMLKDELSRMLA